MSAAPARLHHLDLARAVLLLLGLPFHVATKAIFETGPPALDFQQSLLIGGWNSLTHAFRMFAFFMLAGYFAGMIRERKGTRIWLGERLRRLGLPFLAALLTLGALQFRLQESLLHKPSERFFGLPLALDHFWFLLVLLGYCGLYALIPARWIRPGERMRRAMLLGGPQSLWLFGALALWGLLRHAAEWVPPMPDAPSETLLWLHFLFHGAAFSLGVLVWHSGIGTQLFNLPVRWTVAAIVVLLAIYMPLDPMFRLALGLDFYPGLAGALVLRTIQLPLAYLMTLVLFRVLARLVRGPSRIVSFFVDGALAIYLFHLVWVMALLPRVRAMPIAAELQWLLVSSSVLVLATASYLVARTNGLTALLFCGTQAKTAGIEPAQTPLPQV